MSSVKINRPTTQVPKPTQTVRGKYAEIYVATDKLKPGEWLPIEFPTKQAAYNFRVSAATHRSKVMEATVRGRTVYLRNKPQTNGTRKERGK